LMGLLFLVVGVAVIAGAALLISGRWRDGLPEVPPDGAGPVDIPSDVPIGALSASDIETVRLEQSLRGYRMEDVDVLVDRLTLEIQARDAEIARLRAEADEDPTAP
jgi:DivIVA domain-containing protein